jgi:hypothetical protein
MRRHLMIFALTLPLCMPAAAQRPAPDEQKRTLDTAREIALHYSSKLPDFICTENMERVDRSSPTSIIADRLTIQLSYSGQKESYKLLTMNGNKTDQTLESLEGLISGGEFGSLLLGVFDPASAADFQWKSTTDLRKHHASVYTYRISRAKSHYLLGARSQSGNLTALAAGYHGEIILDSQTSRVLRVTASADDIPSNSGITQSSVEVDYDFIDIAGHSYLLPSHSDAHMERSHRQISNSVAFVDYRKFAAESTIDFKMAAW